MLFIKNKSILLFVYLEKLDFLVLYQAHTGHDLKQTQ